LSGYPIELLDMAAKDCIFELRTVQGACIRGLVEVLKEILADVNLIVDSTGIKLMAMDNSNVALIHLQLEGDKFEVYRCKRSLVLGVNMGCLFKLMKSIGTNDVLTMCVAEKDENRLGITIENTEKKSKTTFYLKLLDIDDERIHVPDTSIEQMVIMPSLDFQRLMRDMHGIGSTVIFAIRSGVMTLTCEGEFASQITEMGDKDSMATEDTIEGRFSLKFLNAFAKSQNLCQVVELYMKRDYPLILLYRVANLGKLRFALAPQVNTV
jgi:proliferating cell nuclear antigen